MLKRAAKSITAFMHGRRQCIKDVLAERKQSQRMVPNEGIKMINISRAFVLTGRRKQINLSKQEVVI